MICWLEHCKRARCLRDRSYVYQYVLEEKKYRTVALPILTAILTDTLVLVVLYEIGQIVTIGSILWGKRNNFPLFRYLSAFHNKFIIGATHILGAITRNIKTNCRHSMFCGPPFTIILQDSKILMRKTKSWKFKQNNFCRNNLQI